MIGRPQPQQELLGRPLDVPRIGRGDRDARAGVVGQDRVPAAGRHPQQEIDRPGPPPGAGIVRRELRLADPAVADQQAVPGARRAQVPPDPARLVAVRRQRERPYLARPHDGDRPGTPLLEFAPFCDLHDIGRWNFNVICVAGTPPEQQEGDNRERYGQAHERRERIAPDEIQTIGPSGLGQRKRGDRDFGEQRCRRRQENQDDHRQADAMPGTHTPPPMSNESNSTTVAPAPGQH
jgi:hypothetical protein